ncbi:MAG: hypothetical protein BAJATHORv1_90082 [Candidatus Thorarchaeota archaeon]|nr:MAG: hypothetical protein BAJATHORv1_90082 [Candidatus Thorarchaeota archaeon]
MDTNPFAIDEKGPTKRRGTYAASVTRMESALIIFCEINEK